MPVGVSIDRQRCMFQGLCATVAPTVFNFDDVDGPVVRQSSPTGVDLDDAYTAEKMCPSRAVVVGQITGVDQ